VIPVPREQFQQSLDAYADHAVNVAARTLYAVESDPELVY
jgi:phosphate uptake regulator